MRTPKISARRLTGAALSLAVAAGSVFLAQRPAASSDGGQARPSNHTPEPVGKIAFSSERDGNYEIYVMNPDGGGQTRLTTNVFDDREPAWSPDGTRIAFASDRGAASGNSDIYVVSLASPDTGFNPPVRLTTNPADDFQPVWSPDGTKIAFTSGRDGNDEIYVMNADGSGQVNVSNNPGGDDFEPAWSPNGQRIAFTSSRDVNEEIYVMDASGGGQANISNNSNGDDRHPSWGGTRIAFQSTRDGNEEIYSMNADGTGQTRLTNNPAADVEPWLSLDGMRIAFASNRDNSNAFEIYTMQSNGSGQTRLTRNGDDNDFEAAFQAQSPPVIGVIVSGTIQLASANATVSEAAGRATVTVTRTGGTTGEAVVDYTATSGTASERSDFTTAAGTLRFAEGETSKTFTIFITNDAFAEFDETINITLSSATNASLGLSAGTLTITDDDQATSAANPIDDPEFFVRQHYIDFLNREPEQTGFNAWVAVLRGCPNQFNTSPTSESARCDRITVSSAFVRSPEYQLKGYYVIRFYLASLGRLPTYLEFVRDIQRIDAPTPEGVAANQTAYAVEFTRRQDFRGIYDPLSNQAYVDRLAQVSGVSPANRAQMVADLNSGAKTRAQVLREFVENEQFTAREFNRGFVASQYYGYLRRDPEPTGFQAWLNYLNANPGDFRTMVNGFMNSQEYRARFGTS